MPHSALDLTPHAWQQAQLGLMYRGLGLRSLSLHDCAAYITSISSYGFADVGSQKSKIDTQQFRALYDSLSLANKARLLLALAPHASSWLSVVPSIELGLHLNPHDLCVGIRWWLGVGISRGLSCPLCPNTALDPPGHQAVTCKKGGDVVPRHN